MLWRIHIEKKPSISQVLMREMRALLALEGDAEGSKAMAIEMVKDPTKTWENRLGGKMGEQK